MTTDEASFARIVELQHQVARALDDSEKLDDDVIAEINDAVRELEYFPGTLSRDQWRSAYGIHVAAIRRLNIRVRRRMAIAAVTERMEWYYEFAATAGRFYAGPVPVLAT